MDDFSMHVEAGTERMRDKHPPAERLADSVER
jgi:hypothetical protein